MLYFWYIIIPTSAVLIERLAWLAFCLRVTSVHPKQAAGIISASGRHFPFGRRWQWPRRK